VAGVDVSYAWLIQAIGEVGEICLEDDLPDIDIELVIIIKRKDFLPAIKACFANKITERNNGVWK
jgi:hypothetical protein